MKASYFQFAPAYLEVERNLDVVERHLEDTDADLVVLPELFTSGYFFRSQEDLESVAEPVPEGHTTQRLQSLSEQTGATLVAGLPEREGSAIYNSAVLIQPEDKPCVYRKVHLFYEETTLFHPGDLGFPVFDVSTREGATYSLGMMVSLTGTFPRRREAWP
jgi:predicted amidohydrolase